MSKKTALFLFSIGFALSIGFTAATNAGQRGKPKQVKQVQAPDTKPRKVKAEPDNAFTRWEKEDVAPIITPAERAAFDKLKTNEEREQFIKIFWAQRDPTPDTEENEYREQHYERIAYANEHFSSGIPGSLTDRGRLYIKFGKPDEVEAHPSGGQYQRLSYEGGGATTTYPFEKWFYRYIPGVGSGVEIEFVDPTGSGEYRIAHDYSEKDAMAHVSGYVPPETAFLREQDSPFARRELERDLEKAPEIERHFVEGIGSPKLEDNPLNFDVRPDFFKLSDNRVITTFTVQTENRDLVFTDVGGLQTARLNIIGRIVNVTDRPVRSFEDVVTTSATVAELTELKNRKSAYSKVVVLEPGRYRVDVIVRDVESGAGGVRHFGFEVPKYEDKKLATSSLILASRLERAEGPEASNQFVIGQTKVIPNLTGLYHQGQPVGVYLQVYNAGIDQTTLRPSVDVEYSMTKDGKEVGKQLEDWRGTSESGDRLTLARLIDTKALTPGDYEITIRVRDQVSNQTLTQASKFTVVP